MINKEYNLEKSNFSFKKLCNRWFIDAFGGMALGLFATLIAGTILAQIATLVGLDTVVGGLLNQVATSAKILMGAGIGVGIAYAGGENLCWRGRWLCR